MLVEMSGSNGGGSSGVFMRACQVVGQKGLYQALVDAVDDAGDWTHQQLTQTRSISWEENDYRPRPCTAVRKARSTPPTPGRLTPPPAGVPDARVSTPPPPDAGVSIPPPRQLSADRLSADSPPISTQQPPAGGLVNHYQNIAHALNGAAPRRAESPSAAASPAAAATASRAAAEPPLPAVAAATRPAPPRPTLPKPERTAPPPRQPPAPDEEEWEEGERDRAEDPPSLPC